MKTLLKTLVISLLPLSLIHGQTGEGKNINHSYQSPYGECKFDKQRGRYGKPFSVTNKEDAISILKSYYSDKKIRIGDVRERRRFFIIEVLDEQGNLVDIILINKKNGRLRSIF